MGDLGCSNISRKEIGVTGIRLEALRVVTSPALGVGQAQGKHTGGKEEAQTGQARVKRSFRAKCSS